MQRRDFLRFLRKPALAVAAAPAVAAASSRALESKHASATAALCRQLASLKDRIEKMDRNYQRTLKAVIAFAALSLGVDLSAAL